MFPLKNIVLMNWVIETFTSQIGNSRFVKKSFSEKSWFMQNQIISTQKMVRIDSKKKFYHEKYH